MRFDFVKMRRSLILDPRVSTMVNELHSEASFISSWLEGTRTSTDSVLDIASPTAMRYAIVSGLLSVWSTAAELTEDGVLRCCDPYALDDIAGFGGFGDAMLEAEFAVFDEQNLTVTLPDLAKLVGSDPPSPVPSHSAARSRAYRERLRERSASASGVTEGSGAELSVPDPESDRRSPLRVAIG